MLGLLLNAGEVDGVEEEIFKGGQLGFNISSPRWAMRARHAISMVSVRMIMIKSPRIGHSNVHRSVPTVTSSAAKSGVRLKFASKSRIATRQLWKSADA